MKILIGADIVPTEPNIHIFSNGEINKVIEKELLEVIKSADYRIFNLEAPLTDIEQPISKYGANLIIPTKCISGIKKLNVNLFTLANNHIMDHDIQGLYSTQVLLKENNIDFVGAGENLEQAKKPYIITKDGVSVGIYACAEHEFSIAGEGSPGANPFDFCESFDHINDLKQECDYVIVLYHGGKEHYRYPSPGLQKICRKMCEKGADLVVCQHSHCVGCEEKYNDSTIVYGQGNFVFDAHSNEYWNTSILINVDISNNIKINYIPLKKENGKVKISYDNILEEFETRSRQIKESAFINEEYKKFADKMINNYIYGICGSSIVFRILNKLSGYRLKKRISQRKKLTISNFIDCEAHRELLLKGLENNRK